MAKQIFCGQDGTITIGGTSITARAREISVTGGERDVELVRAFGSGTNAYFNEKPMDAFECEITYVKDNVDFIGYLLGGSDGTEPTAYLGDAPRNSGFLNKAVVYTWTDNVDVSGAQLRVTLASVFGTSKELSQSYDGFLEETFTFKCLPKDYREDYTSNRVVSALP